ncbi:MAG: 50S ribosomal protein L11 [Nitrospirae bacterium]|jgi:large subunit ribosomal protein L11|nr:50S ribosomal protein L11 [Nitrospirota bacterium]MCL5062976.1 50S ribosomal protein L11 [Nitrospirota bacterium]MDA8214927.1 50S ribosomal protein L11 [Nitrospiraceae bacterium]MDA8339586.1 50S ribosomal protein L11 [Nitrospiraceae bacterium]
MAKKEVVAQVKLVISAGKANPAPPVGPALGPHGINIMEFCKQFNAQTQNMGDTLVPAVLSIYNDRSFTFILKTPPASELIKKAAGVVKGSSVPNKDKVGAITAAQVEEIAKTKLPDLNTTSLESAMNTIKGTARSMGVEVRD